MLLYAYAVAGAVSLLVIPASAKGWFGLEPDPLAAVFAIVLALPWGLPLLGMLSGDSPCLAGRPPGCLHFLQPALGLLGAALVAQTCGAQSGRQW